MANTRAFEHQAGKRAAEQPRGIYYDLLMQVSLLHDYYNRSGWRCPDFRAVPTAACAALMKSLGMLFRDNGIGFSVLYSTRHKDELIAYLRRQAGSLGTTGSGPWTRLSFVLLLQNPYFVNFTKIPVTTDPATQNFYFTNQQAHGETPFILNPGDRVSADELVQTVGTQYRIEVNPEEIDRVVVRDISGEVVISQPVRSSRDNVEKLRGRNPGPPIEVIYLDFSLLPEGKYLIQRYGASAPESVVKEDAVLYTLASGAPLCFIDLLLANPGDGSSGGIYPVQDLHDPDPSVESIRYELRFDRRATVWNYYVVSIPNDKTLKELEIKTIWPEGDDAPVFQLQGPKELPNGQLARQFVSDRSIPLQEQSEYNFRLLRRVALGFESEIPFEDTPLVNRLPVASNQQVIPQKDSNGDTVYSQIYVYV